MEGLSRSQRIREAIKTLVLADAKPVERPEESGYDQGMYLRTLFGYIALVGTSKKAVHEYEVDILGPKSNKNNLDSRGKINIAEKVLSLMTLSRAVSEGPLVGATLRQMCEPFAQEAYEMLTKLAQMGIYSQLAKKMSRLGNKEPQVMFDFASGLDLSKLTLQEATVVQAMHSRLFRTEGAKGVFNAQSSVGEQAVEI
ncbi:Coat protein [Grapevine virus J]|uniref:Coat protein n=1 Tax=Grapevine virus J TaxID=2093496 RepID=A0A2P1BXX8_9VIRU|nr:Coat protein [Grapevine virus J]AVI69649.1 Coat protein [Grapevine virus J]